VPSLIGQIHTNFTAGVPILLMNLQGYPLESSRAAEDLGLSKESKMKKLTSRKLASVLVAGALILGGSVAFTASADAAGKQGTSCTKVNSKSGTYTCRSNPTATTPKLVWITPSCITAQAAYSSNVSDLASSSKQGDSVIALATNTLASFQNARTTQMKFLEDLTNNQVFGIKFLPKIYPPVPTVTAKGYVAAIAAYQAEIVNDQAGLAKYTAALAKDVAGSNQFKSDQASIADFNKAIDSRTRAITTLNRKVTGAQTAITSDQKQITLWTSTLNGAVTSQKDLLDQLKLSVASAKSARTVACKAGL
jgi:hypothetical protein